MMKYIIATMIAFGYSFFTHAAFAYGASENITVASDSRIKMLIYNPNEVYRLNFQYGYQSYIEFGKYEKVETVSIGNPHAWKITPGEGRVFIKPSEGSNRTNMTIFTNKGSYQFEIQSRPPSDVPDDRLAFVVRFFYPKENYDVPPKLVDKKALLPADVINPSNYNYDYTLSGPMAISPLEVFDDGHRTYMKFSANNAVVPIIFSKESDGRLLRILAKRESGYVVLDTLANKYELRMGDQTVHVFNEKFSPRQW